MNRSAFWMIKYMNGSVFSKARYMNGVGFEILARSPVPKLPLSYPPRTYHSVFVFLLLLLLLFFVVVVVFFFCFPKRLKRQLSGKY